MDLEGTAKTHEDTTNNSSKIKMAELSIIIPVYNTEQWIARCLDSCLDQDIPHTDYEVIVVNDGTTDNAMAIVEEYAQIYTNIRIVEQENGGLSKARNHGIDIANGKYIWFVDSDDYIEKRCIGKLLEEANKDNIDVLCFNELMVWDDGRKDRIPLYCNPDIIYNGHDFTCHNDMPKPAWMALYKKSHLEEDNLRFYEGILHEDQEFTPRAYYTAKRIKYIEKTCYYYWQRGNSIMSNIQSLREKKTKDLLTVADSLYEFTQQYVIKDTVAYKKMMNNVAFAYCQSLRNYKPQYFSIKTYKEKPYYPIQINEYQTDRERKKHIIMNISIRLFLISYAIFSK